MRIVLAAWVVIAVLVFHPSPAQSAGAPPHRFALVVGVSDYRPRSLANPTRDARSVEAALKDAAFEVIRLDNPTRGQLRQAVDDLSTRVQGRGQDAIVTFYFAGHAVQFGGENYLIPSGTGLFAGTPAPSDYEDQSVRAQWVLDKLSETGVGRILLILDACRTNPFQPDRRSGPGAEGLAKMSPVPRGPDTMIVFAAEPRFAALDGPEGANSFFTRALEQTIRLPGLDISEVFDVVRRRVRADTQDSQRPHVEGLFRFTFKEAPPAPRVVTLVGIVPERISGAERGSELLKETLRTRTIDDLRRASEEGDGFATYLLGLAFWDGVGVAADGREAARLMRRAVTRGVGRAANSLGYLHCCSGILPKNDEEAVEWFRIGMDLGSVTAVWNLAVRYRNGEGVARDLKEAERLFLLAGERGSHDAYDDAAWLYREDQYGQVNIARAVTLHQRAFDAGYLPAAISLADLYQFDERVPKDVPKAAEYLRRGGEAGCAKCWKALGDLYDEEREEVANPAKASAAYLQGAKAGDADSMLLLGRRLRQGEGVPVDLVASYQWAEQARLAGNLSAIGDVGILFAKGEGVPRDPEKGARLLAEVLALENDSGKRFKVYVQNYWTYGVTLADLHKTRAIANASDDEAARLYARYGHGRNMKRFTIPVQCGKRQTSFHIYIRDWEREEAPTEEQAEWLKAERGCTMPTDVVESLRKVYKIAHDGKVSFVELLANALREAPKTETQSGK